ncbi:MAG: 2-polyprenyl-3-methyl-6-methoxy-1,4-benzoquinone monooxygenase [Proteobacteria bacterium]|nr:2-polyprenyl-3-methyl-6-methoxy-1,4-benzoquinone monooxygenase [Pseudomonadota bacterium]
MMTPTDLRDTLDRLTLDGAIGAFDRALRTVCGVHRASRASPADGLPEGDLDPGERAQAAALMRVNHVGEVCAQALYQGQALTARTPENRDALQAAALEEEDHLEWSAARVQELGGRLSLLNPLWYAGSFAMGAFAGALGDRWSLGFLAETERQVGAHLESHLERLTPEDARTRAVVAKMRDDEARHRAMANDLGAAALPAPVGRVMGALAKVMTTVAYRV